MNGLKTLLIPATFFLGLNAIFAGTVICNESTLSPQQKTQIKSFVDQAQARVQSVGIVKASEEFKTRKFINEQLYIFVIDHNQYSLANGGKPEWIGKDLKAIPNARDSAQKIIEKAKEGGGWVNYVWISPKTQKHQCKTAWVTPMLKDSKSEQVYTIGAGIEH